MARTILLGLRIPLWYKEGSGNGLASFSVYLAFFQSLSSIWVFPAKPYLDFELSSLKRGTVPTRKIFFKRSLAKKGKIFVGKIKRTMRQSPSITLPSALPTLVNFLQTCNPTAASAWWLAFIWAGDKGEAGNSLCPLTDLLSFHFPFSFHIYIEEEDLIDSSFFCLDWWSFSGSFFLRRLLIPSCKHWMQDFWQQWLTDLRLSRSLQ